LYVVHAVIACYVSRDLKVNLVLLHFENKSL
jgi:hypothetical protein